MFPVIVPFQSSKPFWIPSEVMFSSEIQLRPLCVRRSGKRFREVFSSSQVRLFRLPSLSVVYFPCEDVPEEPLSVFRPKTWTLNHVRLDFFSSLLLVSTSRKRRWNSISEKDPVRAETGTTSTYLPERLTTSWTYRPTTKYLLLSRKDSSLSNTYCFAKQGDTFEMWTAQDSDSHGVVSLPSLFLVSSSLST